MKKRFGAINDQDPSLASQGSSVSFGLNQGKFTNLGFTDKAGKDESPGNAFDIEIAIGDKTFKRRIFEVTKVYGKDGELSPGDEDYEKEYDKTLNQALGVIVHAVKATGVSQEAIDKAFEKKDVENFSDWCKVVEGLIPKNYKEKTVDVFLEYEWEIKEGNDRTWLQLPKNMKGGYWLCPATKPLASYTKVNSWTEFNSKINQDVMKKGLAYQDGDDNLHPFRRTQDYMESNKAKMQGGNTNNNLQSTSDIDEDNSASTW